MRLKCIILSLFAVLTLHINAQENNTFKRTIRNSEYKLLMDINLYADSVIVPGQEVLGECYGYIRKTTDTRVWIITDVTLQPDGKTALLELVNDYGSEDLTASLTVDKQGQYILKQIDGSTIKFVENKKWQKLPKELIFK